MLTFFPQSVTVIFSGPSGTLHLAMNIRWSPTIEDDFLSEVDLPIIDVVIGNSRKKSKQSRYMLICFVLLVSVYSSFLNNVFMISTRFEF